jgi:hypothetical protein
MRNYVAPTIVEYGNAAALVKGCGGWGCEVWLRNWSYCQQGDYCVDCYYGESGEC